MRLYAFLDPDDVPVVGALDDEDAVKPLGIGLLDLIRDGSLDDIGRFAAEIANIEERQDRSTLRPAPPLPAPSKIVCVGLNYRAHAAEGGRGVPDRPLVFSKFANTVIGDGAPVIRPEGTRALDLEVELGVVIGKHAHRVPADRAMGHVAGYLVVNDISARDWQGNLQALREGEKGDGQWLRAKGSDTFLPMGPVFVTRDDLDPLAGVALRSYRIPGPGQPDEGTSVLMQNSTTADMIFTIPDLIEFITKVITLEPGDVIATGTPSGVGVFREPPVFLEPGDRVRCEVDGIGSVENPIVDWSATSH